MTATITPDATVGTTSLEEARWRAMLNRTLGPLDPFVIGVRTTGIFCRVGCPARTPHRTNIVFFDAATEARDAGFRACKRCHPDVGDLSPWRSQRQIREDGRGTLSARSARM
ncbi:MAG TPA: Ada metal-binding domain-containing protein [Thermomicrobiales bacterium]|nr:Ada metal-binding domain-containing protein [Thermomicrobiales bacterium]